MKRKFNTFIQFRSHFFLVVLILLSLIGSAQSEIGVDQQKRTKVLEELLKNAHDFQPNESLIPLALETVEFENSIIHTVRVNGNGYLEFEDGSWLYFTSFSSHEDEEVGDITLAIDNSKTIFINEGHVCGGIVHFKAFNIARPAKSNQFIQNFFCDTDHKKWMSFSEKN